MARQPKPKPLHYRTATTAGPAEAEAGGILTIDLGAIFDNYRTLAREGDADRMRGGGQGRRLWLRPGPGHRRLIRAGCKTFFVAHLDEARHVRRLAPEAAIYVLNGFAAGTGPAFADVYARPVINSSVELAEWDQFVVSSGWSGGVGLHVDTGMNRLGMSFDETAAVAMRMQSENHGITLLMSHFACADQPQHPLNDQQIRQFREIRTLFRGIPGSLANSSGIFLDQSAYCDMVRPGSALYGVNPTPGSRNPDEAGGRAARPRAAGAQRAAQRRGRLWRGMDGKTGEPDRRGRRRLRRWHSARRASDGRPRRHRGRQALPDRRARLDGSAYGRRHRPAGQRRAARRPR